MGTGPDVKGTAGDDVIVTGTSSLVSAGAENDLVCVTDSDSLFAYVFAGSGNDVVDASASASVQTVTRLGRGQDSYLGGSNKRDAVIANGADDHVQDAGWVLVSITEPVSGRVGTYTGSGGIQVRSVELDLTVQLDQQILVGGVPAADITGFRAAWAIAPGVVLRGNGKRNHLIAKGCDILIEGMGGDELLASTQLGDCEPKTRMSGGRGGDRLLGSRGADVLISGSGRDRADGQAGRDRCIAEREHNCER